MVAETIQRTAALLGYYPASSDDILPVSEQLWPLKMGPICRRMLRNVGNKLLLLSG